jgi:hypothetical protein
MSFGLSVSSVAFFRVGALSCDCGVAICSVERGQDSLYFFCECLACGSQADAIRGRRGVQERGADGVFELVDLMGEGRPS